MAEAERVVMSVLSIKIQKYHQIFNQFELTIMVNTRPLLSDEYCCIDESIALVGACRIEDMRRRR